MTGPATPGEARDLSVPIEDFGPLSRSLIWALQRREYTEIGIELWRTRALPHHVTTNPFFVNAYARVAAEYLRDVQRRRRAEPGPVHIVELGAGPGRFGHGLIRSLNRLLATGQPARPFRYVMTDISDEHVSWWIDHPALQPFIDDGILDFAVFDVSRDTELRLARSGEILAPGPRRAPALFIANYVLDSVEQDWFAVSGGTVHEVYCRARSTQEEPDLDADGVLSRLTFEPELVPLQPDRFDDPAIGAVLDQYADRLAETTFLVPTVGLAGLDRLERIFDDGSLLISADKGFHREDDLARFGPPDIVEHGSVFSFMVNFDALRRWYEVRGGFALHSAQRPVNLDISAFAAKWESGALARTTAAFVEQVSVLNPEDFSIVSRFVNTTSAPVDYGTAMSLLRLSSWDHEILLHHYETIVAELPGLAASEREELVWSLGQVWDAYFPIGEPADVASIISNLLFGIGAYATSLEFLEHSRRWYGDTAETLYNMALCQQQLGNSDEASRLVEIAVSADPNFGPARTLRSRLDSEIERRPRRAELR